MLAALCQRRLHGGVVDSERVEDRAAACRRMRRRPQKRGSVGEAEGGDVVVVVGIDAAETRRQWMSDGEG